MVSFFHNFDFSAEAENLLIINRLCDGCNYINK
jgi:hypothetical protein